VLVCDRHHDLAVIQVPRRDIEADLLVADPLQDRLLRVVDRREHDHFLLSRRREWEDQYREQNGSRQPPSLTREQRCAFCHIEEHKFHNS
jgi:hypothetical protein